MLGDWSISPLIRRLWIVPHAERDMLEDWSIRSHTFEGIVLFFKTLLQGSYVAFQQAWGLHRYDASGDASQFQIFYEGFSF